MIDIEEFIANKIEIFNLIQLSLNSLTRFYINLFE